MTVRTSDVRRTAGGKESKTLGAVLDFLRAHPSVAWVRRINTGAARGFRLRLGFVGCSDIIGQLKDGRFLAVECKAPWGTLSEEQGRFLAQVRVNRGVSGVARSVDDARAILEAV